MTLNTDNGGRSVAGTNVWKLAHSGHWAAAGAAGSVTSIRWLQNWHSSWYDMARTHCRLSVGWSRPTVARREVSPGPAPEFDLTRPAAGCKGCPRPASREGPPAGLSR